MIFYAIRHKESGKLMPQMKRSKGYTHWNPSLKKDKIIAETDFPRLLNSEKHAKQVISAWAAMPNAEMRGYSNHLGEDDYELRFKDDGRKKEDLEIIQLALGEVRI